MGDQRSEMVASHGAERGRAALRAVAGRGRALNGRGPVRRAKAARLRPQIAPAVWADGPSACREEGGELVTA